MLKIVKSITGEDLNFAVKLVTQSELSGLSEDIDNVVAEEIIASINGETDMEKIKFSPSKTTTLTFKFWNGSAYVTTISPTEFTQSSDKLTEAFLSSFYLIECYDTPLGDNNVLLHTSYINGYQIKNLNTSTYTYSKSYEYSDIYLTKNFINTKETDTFDIYFKYTFFSAKSGKLYLFYNNSAALSKEDNMYFKVTFNKTNMTYLMPTTNVSEILNAEYVNSVNDSNVDNNVISKPVLPVGNQFTEDGEYIIKQ